MGLSKTCEKGKNTHAGNVYMGMTHSFPDLNYFIQAMLVSGIKMGLMSIQVHAY